MSLLIVDMSYCCLCDRYFPSDDARAQHVQLSTNHPMCRLCDRRFANMNSLRTHWVYSPKHYYCVVCEKDFRTPAGLRAHIEYAAVHRDDSEDSDDEVSDIESEASGWEDEVGAQHFPEENTAGFERLEVEVLRQEHLRRVVSGRYDENIGVIEGAWGTEEELWHEDEEWDYEEEDEMYTRWTSGVRASHRTSSGTLSAQEERSLGNAPEAFLGGDPQGSKETTSILQHGTESNADKTNSSNAQETSKVVLKTAEYVCPLCLDTARNITATKCGHVFCAGCIYRALLESMDCPACRKPVHRKDLRRIYMGSA